MRENSQFGYPAYYISSEINLETTESSGEVPPGDGGGNHPIF